MESRAPGDRDLARLAGLALAALAAGFLFQAVPGLDLWVSGFFAGAEGGFPWARAWPLEASHRFVNQLGVWLGGFTLFGLGWSFWANRPLLRLSRTAFSYLALVLALGPGLLANGLFKAHWGRARPRDVEAFGGEAAFTPALDMAGECASNCSFVSGDVSLAAALLALAYLFGRAGRVWTRIALAFTVWIGFVRVAQGAHFLSDAVFAALFSALLVVALKLLVLDGRWGLRGAVEAWGAPRLAALARWREVSLRPALEIAGLMARDLTAPHRARLGHWLVRAGLARAPGAVLPALPGRDLAHWRDRLWLFFLSGPRDFGLERADAAPKFEHAEIEQAESEPPELKPAAPGLPPPEGTGEPIAPPALEEARIDELFRRLQHAEDVGLRRKA